MSDQRIVGRTLLCLKYLCDRVLIEHIRPQSVNGLSGERDDTAAFDKFSSLVG